jgi:hypothetical protein
MLTSCDPSHRECLLIASMLRSSSDPAIAVTRTTTTCCYSPPLNQLPSTAGNFLRTGSPLRHAPLSTSLWTASSVHRLVLPSRPRAPPWCCGSHRLPQWRSPHLLQPATVSFPPPSTAGSRRCWATSSPKLGSHHRRLCPRPDALPFHTAAWQSGRCHHPFAMSARDLLSWFGIEPSWWFVLASFGPSHTMASLLSWEFWIKPIQSSSTQICMKFVELWS